MSRPDGAVEWEKSEEPERCFEGYTSTGKGDRLEMAEILGRKLASGTQTIPVEGQEGVDGVPLSAEEEQDSMPGMGYAEELFVAGHEWMRQTQRDKCLESQNPWSIGPRRAGTCIGIS